MVYPNRNSQQEREVTKKTKKKPLRKSVMMSLQFRQSSMKTLQLESDLKLYGLPL